MYNYFYEHRVKINFKITIKPYSFYYFSIQFLLPEWKDKMFIYYIHTL